MIRSAVLQISIEQSVEQKSEQRRPRHVSAKSPDVVSQHCQKPFDSRLKDLTCCTKHDSHTQIMNTLDIGCSTSD